MSDAPATAPAAARPPTADELAAIAAQKAAEEAAKPKPPAAAPTLPAQPIDKLAEARAALALDESRRIEQFNRDYAAICQANRCQLVFEAHAALSEDGRIGVEKSVRVVPGP